MDGCYAALNKTGLGTVQHWLPSVTLLVRLLPWKFETVKIEAFLSIGSLNLYLSPPHGLTPASTAQQPRHSRWVEYLPKPPRGLAGKLSVYPAITVSKHLWKLVIPTKENARTSSGELADGCP